MQTENKQLENTKHHTVCDDKLYNDTIDTREFDLFSFISVFFFLSYFGYFFIYNIIYLCDACVLFAMKRIDWFLYSLVAFSLLPSICMFFSSFFSFFLFRLFLCLCLSITFHLILSFLSENWCRIFAIFSNYVVSLRFIQTGCYLYTLDRIRYNWIYIEYINHNNVHVYHKCVITDSRRMRERERERDVIEHFISSYELQPHFHFAWNEGEQWSHLPQTGCRLQIVSILILWRPRTCLCCDSTISWHFCWHPKRLQLL